MPKGGDHNDSNPLPAKRRRLFHFWYQRSDRHCLLRGYRGAKRSVRVLTQISHPGQHYSRIAKECIIKAKPNDTAKLHAFRIYRITKPLNGIVSIYGQHISYTLPMVPVMSFTTESHSPQLILNQLLAGDSRFTGRTDYSEAKPFSVAQPKSARVCLGGSEGFMLSKRHGEFEWNNFTVKFHTHRGHKTGVVIKYANSVTRRPEEEMLLYPDANLWMINYPWLDNCGKIIYECILG